MQSTHIIMEFDSNSTKSKYIQLYEHIRDKILSGEIGSGSKLPSLRSLAQNLGISVTTVNLAYSQLTVEGYINSKEKSGYYASNLSESDTTVGGYPIPQSSDVFFEAPISPFFTDPQSFDFSKWKKTSRKIFDLYSDSLLFESDPQGEAALRKEISAYVYQSRGVVANADQIVVGAGTQQLTRYLCRILRLKNIGHIATEDPGYIPVQNIFRENDFVLSHIPVLADGIDINLLPVNVPSAVYVSPSNQFPTGSVMGISKRYELLRWAEENHSYILEDDYDSELRYFGNPIPALQGLDRHHRVVYLGSFSSTLFPAIRISYMILPIPLAEIFRSIKEEYTQTCSKAEQLTLALFMNEGSYGSAIRRTRKLYAQKLSAVVKAFNDYGKDIATPLNTQSGINIILRVTSKKDPELLSNLGKSIGLQVVPITALTDTHKGSMIFYYNQIPLEKIPGVIKKLMELWSN